jgi:hypothetical protein
MAPDPREALARPIDGSLLRSTAARIAGDAQPAERAAASGEFEEFMARHDRCAVLRTEGPATIAAGSRMTAECLDCGETVGWWKAPDAVTALIGLN